MLNDNVTLLNLINSTNELITHDSNYLPRGTVITVAADGSGDFIDIEQAISSLENKWSNGVVSVYIKEGIYTVNNQLHLNGSKMGIPYLVIYGDGTDKTVIQSTITDGYILFYSDGLIGDIHDIKFVNTNNTRIARGVCSGLFSKLRVGNIWVDNVNDYALGVIQGAELFLDYHIKLTNCNYGFCSECGKIDGAWNTDFNVSNIGTLYHVVGGGTIRIAYPQITKSNVTTIYGQSNGAATKNGWIAIQE